MRFIWLDGHLVEEHEATISVLTHTLHYGVGVFEGIRAYPSDDGGGAIFRLEDHLLRLEQSARVCGLALPYGRGELVHACLEVLEANHMREGYLRPLVFQGDARLTGLGSSPPCHVSVSAHDWGSYLGDEGKEHGIRVQLAAWRRAGPAALLSRAKITGQYVLSVLAKREALAQGFDEALLGAEDGSIVEGTGENLFLVEGSVLVTPPLSAPVLPGITRDTVLHLARDRGVGRLTAVREELVPRDRLMLADEVFLTGTAAEITPVRQVDARAIGDGRPGPVTRAMQEAYAEMVRGRLPAAESWRTTFGALVR